ncbi:CHAT domain-containing protein [Vararia minispora EC-137]|uniref:CHAT domain-containing protein n=1 Tax=Vararia minispora EC-137 TaxID=1314806 RepID=A0ACB8QP73_9AGAM|nr:CHAT domain-containing protein [Vararia minispora EC-137]
MPVSEDLSQRCARSLKTISAVASLYPTALSSYAVATSQVYLSSLQSSSEQSKLENAWLSVMSLAPERRDLAVSLLRLASFYSNSTAVPDRTAFLALSALRVIKEDRAKPDPEIISKSLFTLGSALHSISPTVAQLPELDVAIRAFTFCAQLSEHDDVTGQARSYAGLAIALLRRFEQIGRQEDLDKVFIFLSYVLKKDGIEDSLRASLHNSLGIAYRHQFSLRYNQRPAERELLIQDMNEALYHLHKATSLSPSTSQYLGGLAITEVLCAEIYPDPSNALQYLQAAVQHSYRAMYGVGRGDPNPSRLEDCGNVLQRVFRKTRDPQHCDLMLQAMKGAVDYTPEKHDADMARRLYNLGTGYHCRFLSNPHPESHDDRKAIHCLKKAVELPASEPSIQFAAACLWSQLAPLDDLDAYRAVVNLAPKMAWLGADIRSIYRDLPDIARVIRRGVTAAINSGKLQTAVEWFEAGRCVVWRQALGLRTSVAAQLPQDCPREARELAEEIDKVSCELGRVALGSLQAMETATPEQRSAHRRKLATEYDELLQHASTVPCLHALLRPASFGDILKATTAHAHPIVCLNLDGPRCDALVLYPNHPSVLHVPLSAMSSERADGLRASLETQLEQERLLDGHGPRMRGLVHDQQAPGTMRTSKQIEEILEELWNTVVKPILGSMGLLPPRFFEPLDNLRRISWCPSGSLTTLPLHAAGIYASPGPKIFDFIVPSYKPSLTGMGVGSAVNHASRTRHSLLAVSQEADGLTHTTHEVSGIQRRLDKASCSVTWLHDRKATLSRVLEAMQASTCVHFACHGEQDRNDPLRSSFILANHERLTLGRLMKDSMATDPSHSKASKELAFLSACETAAGDQGLADEQVHLAAGMLAVGFRRVVGTMWRIRDEDAKEIAGEFYRGLVGSDRHLQPSRAAQALHDAVGRLRGDGTPILHWASLIHIET